MPRHLLSSPLVYLPEFFLLPFQEWSRVSYKGDSPDVNLFDHYVSFSPVVTSGFRRSPIFPGSCSEF